ncbi:MAG: M67 family metallopeptidase [Nitrospirae bacterium]|nr:MAG: M67 family metallopeptidase [Nitrospirota bacterium]
MPVLKIPQDILDAMVSHARELDPFECCGLLAGKHGTVTRQYRITNTVAQDARATTVFEEAGAKQLGHLSATTRAEVAYFMDPKGMLAAFKDMRERQFDLAAIYHSHTHSPAYPSATDIGLAYYPEAAYLIISLEEKSKPDIRAYWIRDRRVIPTEFVPI